MEAGGWHVDSIDPCGLLYSGYGLAGSRLGLGPRRRLAAMLGSSTLVLAIYGLVLLVVAA